MFPSLFSRFENPAYNIAPAFGSSPCIVAQALAPSLPFFIDIQFYTF